ncbi:MAG: Nif3-like dinuclear metal center hexameric protein [Chloroflexota bacterium]|nr:Nif3-like dinuclear metal center hexameric protein [Chloroflexota bacterium]
MAVALDEIARFLDGLFGMERFGDDQGGVYSASERTVRRLGLVLEGWPQIGQWVEDERLDALFAHRPWHLPLEELGDVGVLSYHLAFDEKLTTGYNPRLAEALGMRDLEALGAKQGRPIGMLGGIAPSPSWYRFCRTVAEVFGGCETVHAGAGDEVTRVAVVGAMTDALVCEATMRGAKAYVTGQVRQPAMRAVEETGIGVVAVGHRRCEEWGLRALAGLLEERWSGLKCVRIEPSHQ